jgi:putative PIN family toxin of toxin-antitoxin system
VKIVLDTNVLVSGLLNANGNPARILNLVLSGALQICHNNAILSEYREVLARPRFKFDPLRTADVLEKLAIDGIEIDASAFVDLGLPDPDDEPFLAVALASSSDFLVTGNIAHFPLAKRHGCSVTTPAEFIAVWNSRNK